MRPVGASPRQRPQRPLGPSDPRQPDAKRQGLTRAEVDAWFRAQKGLCAACLKPLSATFVVDHDHSLAAAHGHRPDVGCRLCVRGLVDRKCNALIGWAGEDADFLRRLTSYVEHRRSG